MDGPAGAAGHARPELPEPRRERGGPRLPQRRRDELFHHQGVLGTFAASADDGAKGLEKLADDYKSLQAARDAYGQVKPLAEQWSKALSTGMDNPAKR